VSFSENLRSLRKGCSFGFARFPSRLDSEPNEDGRSETFGIAHFGREEPSPGSTALSSGRFGSKSSLTCVCLLKKYKAVVRVSPTANSDDVRPTVHLFVLNRGSK